MLALKFVNLLFLVAVASFQGSAQAASLSNLVLTGFKASMTGQNQNTLLKVTANFSGETEMRYPAVVVQVAKIGGTKLYYNQTVPLKLVKRTLTITAFNWPEGQYVAQISGVLNCSASYNTCSSSTVSISSSSKFSINTSATVVRVAKNVASKANSKSSAKVYLPVLKTISVTTTKQTLKVSGSVSHAAKSPSNLMFLVHLQSANGKTFNVSASTNYLTSGVVFSTVGWENTTYSIDVSGPYNVSLSTTLSASNSVPSTYKLLSKVVQITSSLTL